MILNAALDLIPSFHLMLKNVWLCMRMLSWLAYFGEFWVVCAHWIEYCWHSRGEIKCKQQCDMQQNSFGGYSPSLDKYDYFSLKKGGVRFAKGRQQRRGHSWQGFKRNQSLGFNWGREVVAVRVRVEFSRV